jgi:predicted AlkP superfamily pyrophosphatase or phosphodiesterase
MHPLVVLNVVGLTQALIGPSTPNIARFAARGELRPVRPITPAVTCTVQATFLTGLLPSGHGVVANGWLYRDLMEVWLWRQSNRLLSGARVWDDAKARDPRFTSANLFWWFAMASGVDFTVTPRPIYKADGLKVPDCYTAPPEIRDELNARLGPFPLFEFWGPATSIRSTKWIADAALHVMRSRDPTLTLVYLPHLDYGLQRHGPDIDAVAKDLAEIDAVAGVLIEEAEALGRRVVILSEYGIVPVARPVHINRALREAGLIAVRVEQGGELLDVAQSRAFAVADHQIAHVYIADPKLSGKVKQVLEQLDGVDQVLDEDGKRSIGLDHARSGELVVLAKPDAWFTYYYWLNDDRAPEFARTVEIHRKPGYDPVELFLDPAIRFPRIALGRRLLKRSLGFRALMDVIPLDAGLVKGSHGRVDVAEERGPLLISSVPEVLPLRNAHATEVKALLLAHMFDEHFEEAGRMAAESRNRSHTIPR